MLYDPVTDHAVVLSIGYSDTQQWYDHRRKLLWFMARKIEIQRGSLGSNEDDDEADGSSDSARRASELK